MMEWILIILVSLTFLMLCFLLVFLLRGKRHQKTTEEEKEKAIAETVEAVLQKEGQSLSQMQSQITGVSSKVDALVQLVHTEISSLERDFLSENRHKYKELSDLLSSFEETVEKRLAEGKEALRISETEQRDAIYQQLQLIHQDLKETTTTFVSETDKEIKNMLESEISQMVLRLENIDKTVKERMERMETGNQEKLDSIQKVVEEKLDKTLSMQLRQSFESLLAELAEVTKAVGEIQNMSKEVSSLRNILTNLKTRGIVGEVVLGNLISDVLTKDQYACNVVTKKGSNDPVEYAIRMPGKNGEAVLMPVDSKFPLEDYRSIKEALEEGDKEKLQNARKSLKNRIRAFSKEIHDKYIDVPYTTDFAILFLPVESLYSEVAELGLVEEMQREFHICIVSPSTFQALLNALQMGFRSVSIEKKSVEIIHLLYAVKKQFDSFSQVLEKTQSSLLKASDDLKKLVGTRTRQLKKQLDKIEEIGYLSDEEKDETTGE